MKFPTYEDKVSTNLAEVGTDCISRQAAIDAVKERYYKYGRFAKIEELVWSIEKLQPIRPVNNSENPNSSDVVSRQKARNAICNACGKIDCDEMDTCKKLDIPSEESKALGWQYRTYIPHNKYCPKCKKDSPYNKRWNFCPNCGADMRGEPMDDLISRRAAIDELDKGAWGVEWDKALAKAMIESLPSAQPEVIRCKDCKHWIPYDWMFSEIWQSKNIADYPEDEIGCNWSDMAMKADDFCSRAERRTE